MTDTKKINMLDVVTLLQDLPEYGVKKGEQGVVVEIFNDGEAYCLEFVDETTGEGTLAYEVKAEIVCQTNDNNVRWPDVSLDEWEGVTSRFRGVQ